MTRIKPHHKRYPYLHPSRSSSGCAVTVLLAVGALAGVAGAIGQAVA